MGRAFARPWKVKLRVTLQKHPRGVVIRAGCFLFVVEPPEIMMNAVNANRRLPRLTARVPGDAFETTGAVRLTPVCRILPRRAKPKVRAPVVERIAVQMVNDHASGRARKTSVHELDATTTETPNRVELTSRVTGKRPPSERGKRIEVFVIDQGDKAARERDFPDHTRSTPAPP